MSHLKERCPPSRRGRPRDDGLDARVLDAVVLELSEVGVSGFSINSVCARASVAKRSISVRWSDRESLILDGLNSLAAGLAPPKTGSLKADLHRLSVNIGFVMAEPRRSILARCAAEFRVHPRYYAAFRYDSLDRCMAAVEDVLFDAAQRGEVRDEVDLGVTADCFVSAIIGSRSFADLEAVAADRVSTQLVDIFVRGLGVDVADVRGGGPPSIGR